MIADTICTQYGSSLQSSLVYAKPYSRWIEEMRMSAWLPTFEVPMFRQKKKRRATCLPILLKHVTTAAPIMTPWRSSLYTLSERSIRMSKEELVEEYIERWRNLVLNCKERISEASSIDMCVQDMHWGLLYNLQANMPHSFQELATRAHDLEIQIARHGSYLPSNVRDKKNPKKKIKRDGLNPGSNPKPEFRPNKVQVQRKGLLTLKELEEKEYPFSDSEVSGILDQLFEQKVIELPPPKRPEEAGQVVHPKYCRFHQIISHLVERCFVLKDLIVRLDKENKIKLETDEHPNASYSMVSFGSFDPISISNKGQTFLTTYDAGESLSEVAEFGPQLPK
ncbi:Uncharacterized protein Adt_40666 [Abeliophyllum distichum]|uniref:Retrotransposon gag protein n=1 Tax=Abeliophyllum distichum TaxID=126358 RepID=A0ABD1Q8K0_9LAMI